MSKPSLPGYENLDLIGKGGFSRVYQADQAKLKRKVAVKVLNFGLNDEADRVSFSRETELMGRVSTHPNIVTVHDTAFTADGRPCIVMELYPGGSLADLINEAGRLNTREALEVGVAIASALEASHQSGVLHCDLKPQNILISQFGQPALGDFGISTFAEEHTRTGKDAGAGFTLPYASPEIVEGESPTITSDVYSLAATLYTSLSGRRPFAYATTKGTKPTAAEQARRILLEPVPSLIDAGVPVELDALIRTAMSKDPADRPQSASAFARACHEIGQGLGLGTPVPRIAHQGALPIIDADAVGQGQVDLSQIVKQRELDELRSFEPSLDVTPSGEGFGQRRQDVSASRRRSAAVAGLLAVLGVGAVLFIMTRGGGDPVVAPVDPVNSASVQATDPVFAPTRPSNVTLERAGATDVAVSWQVPAAELEAGDVVYEVRRQDGATDMVSSATNMATLSGIADNEGVCVVLLAVRGNRTSSPTDPVCASPLAVDIQIEPANCQTPCQVTLTIAGDEPREPHAVAVVDRSLNDMADAGWQFDDAAVPDGGPWELALDEVAESGQYLVVVTFPDASVQSALLELE